MFGLGLWEIIVIVILILVVSKPEDLPKLLKKVGKIYGQCQRFYSVIIDEVNSISTFSDKN